MNPEQPLPCLENKGTGIPANYPIPHLKTRQGGSDIPTLGWIGFGSMGRAMAGRLLEAGVNLVGYNRDREKIPSHPNLSIALTPGEVSKNARILFLMLTDGPASKAVLDGPSGVLSHLSQGTIIINMSTISPKEALKEDQMVRDAGGSYLDIPVSGSVLPARNGQLLLLAGGSEKTLSPLSPVLSILGKETIHLGAVGAGMTGKLIINTLLAAQMKALSQTVAMGEELGFLREKVLDLVFRSPLSCAFYQLKKDNLSDRTYPKAFSVALMEKDLSLAIDECSGRSINPNFPEEVRAPFKKALDQGMGDLDLSAIFEILRRPNP